MVDGRFNRRIIAFLDESLLTRAQERAEKENCSLSEVVRKALDDYLHDCFHPSLTWIRTGLATHCGECGEKIEYELQS